MSNAVHIFISHISEEQAEALKAKEYLERAFGKSVEVFAASSWTSIAPGEDWFQRISEEIDRADVMLVMCSGDSVNRPWLQFETGAGWFARKAKVIPVCHKGMTPRALPEPIRRLQAVDINADTESEQLRKLADAVKTVAALPEPVAISAEELSVGIQTRGEISLRGWFIRPAAHVGEEYTGNFKVGSIDVAHAGRASEAGLDPNDTVFARLFEEPPTGFFLNTMAAGDVAALLEPPGMEGAVIQADLKLAAIYQGALPDQRAVPLIVILRAERRQH